MSHPKNDPFLVGKPLWLLGKPTICSRNNWCCWYAASTLLQVAGLEEELKEKAVVVAEKAPGFGGDDIMWWHEDMRTLCSFFIVEVHQWGMWKTWDYWKFIGVMGWDSYEIGLICIWITYIWMFYVVCLFYILVHFGSFWIPSMCECFPPGPSTLRVFSVRVIPKQKHVMVLVITVVVDVIFF